MAVILFKRILFTIVIGIVFLFPVKSQTSREIDSLIANIDQVIDKGTSKEKLALLQQFTSINDFANADRMLKSILHDYPEKGEIASRSPMERALLYSQIGNIYINNNYELLGLRYLLKGYQLGLVHGTEDSLNWTMVMLGNIYFHQREYNKAEYYYRRALKSFIKVESMVGPPVIYNNIGLIKQNLQQYDSAIIYYKIGLNFRKITYDKGFPLAHSYRYLGDIYLLKKNFPVAEYYYRLAQKNSPLKGAEYYEKLFLVELNQSLANFYREKHDYSQALHYQLMALKKFHDEELADSVRYAQILLDVSKEYYLLGKTDSASYYGWKSFYTGNKAQHLETSLSALNFLLTLNRNLKNPDTNLFLKYNNFIDSLLNKTFVFQGKDFQYAIENIENEHALENQTARLERYRINRNYILGLSASLLLLALVLGLAYRRQRISTRKMKELNQKIIAQKANIEQKQQQLESLNQELSKLVETKDKFFSLIAHDLTNLLGVIAGFAEIMLDQKENCKESLEYLTYIDQAASQALNLLHNLLEWARSNTGMLTFVPESIHVNEIIKNVMDLTRPMAIAKKVKIGFSSENDDLVELDVNMFKTIARNLVSNAIKFSLAGQEVIIRSYKSKNYYCFEVQDHGIGIAPERISIQNGETVISSQRGTMGEKGSGLGLMLCRQFASLHNGKITFESEEGKGSTFRFIMPIDKNI